MQRKRQQLVRKCGFENLENRQLMAGDVSLAVSEAGNLFVTGDDIGNQIQIHKVSGNFWRISGDAGTKIEGENAKVVRVTGNINVNLKGGNDRLKMGGIAFADELAGNLNVLTGAGSDTIDFGRVTVRGTTTINTEGDPDTVSLGLLGIYNDLVVKTGAGDDSFTANRFIATNLTVDGEAGKDAIDVRTVTVAGAVNLLGGTENDTIHSRLLLADTFLADGGAGSDSVTLNSIMRARTLNVLGGIGNDSVTMDTVVANGVVSINTGADADTVRFTNGVYTGDISILTGAGVDHVIMSGSNTNNVLINTGTDGDLVDILNVVARNRAMVINTGADTENNTDAVTITNLKSGSLKVNLGGGNDQFKLKDTKVDTANINGGSGVDAFFDLLGNSIPSLVKVSFP